MIEENLKFSYLSPYLKNIGFQSLMFIRAQSQFWKCDIILSHHRSVVISWSSNVILNTFFDFYQQVNNKDNATEAIDSLNQPFCPKCLHLWTTLIGWSNTWFCVMVCLCKQHFTRPIDLHWIWWKVTWHFVPKLCARSVDTLTCQIRTTQRLFRRMFHCKPMTN